MAWPLSSILLLLCSELLLHDSLKKYCEFPFVLPRSFCCDIKLGSFGGSAGQLQYYPSSQRSKWKWVLSRISEFSFVPPYKHVQRYSAYYIHFGISFLRPIFQSSANHSTLSSSTSMSSWATMPSSSAPSPAMSPILCQSSPGLIAKAKPCCLQV